MVIERWVSSANRIAWFTTPKKTTYALYCSYLAYSLFGRGLCARHGLSWSSVRLGLVGKDDGACIQIC